jgi:CubicO group peptidase (beta-lactamase class C family)
MALARIGKSRVKSVNFMVMHQSAPTGSAWNRQHGNRPKLTWQFALIAALCLTASAEDNGRSLPTRLEALVDARFRSTKCPGLSVAVASANEIVFSKALGTADLEQDVALKTDSVQRLGSLSKPISGTIIMDLVEQGTLSLDASIRQYLPELPDTYQKVTLRHLLSHQSGVRGYTNPADVAFSVTHYATSRGP